MTTARQTADVLQRVFPGGGSALQVVTKVSGADYDYSWEDSAGGSGTPPTTAAETGDALLVGVTPDKIPVWATVPLNGGTF